MTLPFTFSRNANFRCGSRDLFFLPLKLSVIRGLISHCQAEIRFLLFNDNALFPLVFVSLWIRSSQNHSNSHQKERHVIGPNSQHSDTHRKRNDFDKVWEWSIAHFHLLDLFFWRGSIGAPRKKEGPSSIVKGPLQHLRPNCRYGKGKKTENGLFLLWDVRWNIKRTAIYLQTLSSRVIKFPGNQQMNIYLSLPLQMMSE